MADLVISEAEGWEELEDVQGAIASGELDEHTFWNALGQGDHRAALEELYQAGWFDDEDEPPSLQVYALREPDDIIGSRLRVWVRER